MESKKNTSSTTVIDELANLKKITEVDNYIKRDFGDLVITAADESHVKEIAELWANLASIQQVFAPERYSFRAEGKDWQQFVRNKLAKKNNLLLVMQKRGDYEVRGFLYLQTITLPSSDLIVKGIIEDIYTKPQYRKQDVASNMLDVALDWTISHNIKQVDLISLSNTKGLIDFYSNFLKRFKKDIKLELLTF